MELLTFTEAAAFAGVSSKTIHKHVKQGKLASVDTPLGRRIEKELLVPYRNLLGTVDTTLESKRSPEGEEKGTFGSAVEQSGDTAREVFSPEDTVWEQQGSPVSTVPLQAHLVALEFARTQLERAQSWLDEERQRAQLAQQLVLQAERAKIALESQLSQYQRVLSEQAESLAEERALRLTWEARSQVGLEPDAPLADPKPGALGNQTDELEQHNELQKQLWEAEKAELIGAVTTHQRRVQWLEKKVPRWLRSLLGA